MTKLLSPSAKQQFFTDGSTVAAGYSLYIYAANTTTPETTYANRAGTVENANPIVLNARGEATIYLTQGVVYDYVLKTPLGATVWTQEDVAAETPGDAAVPVTRYATDAQLAVDATAATQSAIDYAISSGIKRVHFPGGRTYRFAAASAAIDPGVGDLDFIGDGMNSSILVFEEGTATGDIGLRKNLFANTDDVTKGSLSFSGLQFKGTWQESGYTSGQGGTTMLLDYYDEIVIEGCKFTNLKSYVTACEFIQNVRVIGCTFDTNARDNCRFRSSFNVQVIGNRFAHCDDDAVALHCNTNVTGGDIREGIVVADNIFEDCPAVQIIGGRMVSVHHNILRRCKQNGILVYTSAGTASEGDSSIFAIDVSNNQIYDMMNDYPFTTGVSQVIGVYQRSAEAISGSVIPGSNITASGTFPLPWDHRNGQHDSTTDGIPPPFFIRIQNNIIARTLPAVAAYSTWGYGSAYAGDGPHDPAVTNTSLRPNNGIIIGGQARKALISGNIVSHCGSCIALDADPLSNYTGDGVIIRDNVLSDFSASAVALPAPAGARGTNLRVLGNDIDGDPYHVSSNRGSAGTWLADTVPNALSCVSYQGVHLAHNKIRNVARVLDNGGSTSTVAIDQNILRADPAATGFSTSNKGIGNCPIAGPGYEYEIFDCDPTSATYGGILTNVSRESSAMPATGKYVAGTFLRANTGTTLFGWKRLTTGSAHIAGTDWKTVVLT